RKPGIDMAELRRRPICTMRPFVRKKAALFRAVTPALLQGSGEYHPYPDCPPVTSIVRPVTKSASDDARKQITLAWSDACATRRSGVFSICACCAWGERWFQCGVMRSVNVRLGAMALMLTPNGPSSNDSLRVMAMIPPFAAASATPLETLIPRPAIEA